jgi:hypothetical protein
MQRVVPSLGAPILLLASMAISVPGVLDDIADVICWPTCISDR